VRTNFLIGLKKNSLPLSALTKAQVKPSLSYSNNV
jgi:hypothetical protein